MNDRQIDPFGLPPPELPFDPYERGFILDMREAAAEAKLAVQRRIQRNDDADKGLCEKGTDYPGWFTPDEG